MAGACGLLGACSHSIGDAAAPLVKRHAAATPQGGDAAISAAANAGLTDLVSAVSATGGNDGPVGLKFQLAQRPESGKPVSLIVRLVANQELEHLQARFRADDGLELTQGGEFAPQEHLSAGTVLDQTLMLVPDHDGIYAVTATVTSGAAAEAVSRRFVIPIVVGAPAPEVPLTAKPMATKH